MTTFYLDLESGNDSNAGTSFALRWLTPTTGATAARIAPGDTIRVMASPDATSVGNATWTNNSRTVTLAGAVTANVDTGESAWTASSNVTCSTSSTRKEGSLSSSIAIASGFTTGKAAFKALAGSTDFSAYQQLSFWVRNDAAIANGATLKLCLCSDAAGATPVDTFFIPAIPSTNSWVAFTVNKGSALGSAIQSVALYADSDPGTITLLIDNIIAVKSVASADSLSLTSLIGKDYNLNWAATTAYSLNAQRRPSVPNRNGLRYKVTTAGTTGSSEPTWPTEWGQTVTDGTVVWTCIGNEETYYPIQSINGTTVLLDVDTSNDPTITTGKYQGATESVGTYKREPIKMAMLSASFFSFSTMLAQDTGTADSPITFSGGWNRTDMSTQTGETWTSGQSGLGIGLWNNNSKTGIVFENLNGTRAGTAIEMTHTYGEYNTVRNCQGTGLSTCAIRQATAGGKVNMRGINGSNCLTVGMDVSGAPVDGDAVTVDGNGGGFPQAGLYHGFHKIRLRNFVGRGNSTEATLNGAGTGTPVDVMLSNVETANNAGGAFGAPSGGKMVVINALIGESTTWASPQIQQVNNSYVYVHKNDNGANDHVITTYGGTITSDTSTRHTASGVAWRFNPTNLSRNSQFPLERQVCLIKCTANIAVTVKIWTRRDNTNIHGRLMLKGGQITGVPYDVSVTSDPTINTWVESSALTFTPTEDGVVEVQFDVWDGTGTTNGYWIDDLTVTS